MEKDRNLKDFNDDLTELILDQLADSGIDTELLHFSKKGAKIIVSGTVSAENDRNIVMQAVSEIYGSKVKVLDRLEILDNLYDAFEEDLYDIPEDSDLYSDDDVLGTEDIFKSMEEGIPYIPPMDENFSFERIDKPKRKKKR